MPEIGPEIPATLRKSALFRSEFRLLRPPGDCEYKNWRPTYSEQTLMRGKSCAALVLGLCAAALLVADAGTEDAPAAAPKLNPTVIVLDASKSMSEKLGDKSKIEAVHSALGEALGTFGGKLS